MDNLKTACLYNAKLITFAENNELRFIPRDDIRNAGVVPSTNDPCVVVPVEGIYKIESQITFKFHIDTKTSRAAHILSLTRSSDGYERIQTKRTVLAPKTYSAADETLLESSNISILSHAKANEKICVKTFTYELIYNSKIDNVLDVELRYVAEKGVQSHR